VRCYSCHRWSFALFCAECRGRLLQPTIKKRRAGSLDIYSFFSYSTIEPLLLRKHTSEGYRIYKELARIVMRPFVEHYTENLGREIHLVGIDERVKNGYSHIAVMMRQMRMRNVKMEHAALLSTSSVSYAGRSLQYRLNNPRNFVYNGREGIEVVLIDDIVTTGLTLQEARRVLQEHGVKVDFALVLADAAES